jgi:hypothetical protein
LLGLPRFSQRLVFLVPLARWRRLILAGFMASSFGR